MKLIVAVSMLVVLVAVVQAQKPQRLPLEGIDVDGILKNTKLINKHISCVRKEGKCDTDGKNMKIMLPRVLNEKCSGCSQEQVTNSNKIIDWMKQNRAADWAFIEPLYKL